MMVDNKVSTSSTSTKTWQNYLFMVLVGVCLGILGGFINRLVASIIGAALLLGLFGAYNNVISNKRGMMSGLVAGGITGLTVGIVGFLLGGIPTGVVDAAVFGFVRGMLFGAVVGFLTRARSEEGDTLSVSLFLTGGSIVVGAFLGAGVGLVTGFLLGVVLLDWWGTLVALLLGVIVGGYLGSYFLTRRAIIYGAILFGVLGFVSTFIHGSLQGLTIGMIAGALTPMLVVSLIGFGGGLSSRGLRAGLAEAGEAPAEMIQQGAVPFLAPSMLAGIIVGTASSGESGIIALAVTVAAIGMILGVITEIERGQTNRMTVRRLIEMVMLGSDRWPIERMYDKISGKNQRAAIIGSLTGIGLGVVGAGLGFFVGQQLANLFSSLM